jgi:DNA polymerase epsilon subunit 1
LLINYTMGKPFRRVGRQGQSNYGPRTSKPSITGIAPSALLGSERTSAQERIESTKLANGIDEKMGFTLYDAGRARTGWLVNMHSTTTIPADGDSSVSGGKAAVELYFIGEDGNTFKARAEHAPYFLIAVKRGREAEVEEWIRRACEGLVKEVKREEKDDLQMANHLVGVKRGVLQLVFENVQDLLSVRRVIMPIVEKNRKKKGATDAYTDGITLV